MSVKLPVCIQTYSLSNTSQKIANKGKSTQNADYCWANQGAIPTYQISFLSLQYEEFESAPVATFFFFFLRTWLHFFQCMFLLLKIIEITKMATKITGTYKGNWYSTGCTGHIHSTTACILQK